MVVAMTAGTISAFGQTTEDDFLLELNRFKLYNNCRPMMLVVEELPDDAKEIGLTRRRLLSATEARLRSARLYTDDYERSQGAYLYVNVLVVGRAFNLTVQYNKSLYDPLSDLFLTAATWTRGNTGAHGGDAGYIMQAVYEKIDEFLLAYLRVNEEDCN